MRRTYILLLFCSSFGVCIGQNKIVLKSGERLEPTRYVITYAGFVRYILNGFENEVAYKDVAWIEMDDSTHLLPDEEGILRRMHVRRDTLAVKPQKSPWDLSPAEHKAPVKSITINALDNAPSKSLYEQGFVDAKKNFHAQGSTLLGIVSLPAIGIIYDFSPRVGHNENDLYPYLFAGLGINLLNVEYNKPTGYTKNTDPAYLAGFKKGMRRKKCNNTLLGMVATAAIVLAFALVVTSGGD